MRFHVQTSVNFQPNSAPMRRALENWRLIWLARGASITPESHLAEESFKTDGDVPMHNLWKRIGFMRHAPEFWLLAWVVLERVQHVQNRINNHHAPTSGTLHNSRTEAPFTTYLPSRYDETDMSQVNHIIHDFKALL